MIINERLRINTLIQLYFCIALQRHHEIVGHFDDLGQKLRVI